MRAHVVDVPQATRAFCGELLTGARVLNVGCGDMLADHGLLHLGPAHIMGLDVSPLPEDWRERTAARVAGNGHDLAADHAERMDFTRYAGTDFPFADASFDICFSWSAFEHVADVGAVLREMRRVLVPGGHAFVQVYPWFHAADGSHLSQWIAHPWFHLTERDSWVRARLEAHVAAHGGGGFLLDHMYPEYVRLNRITVSDLYEAARRAGFDIVKASLISYDEDLSHAPDGVPFADLMIRGSQMLMRKSGRSPAAIPRSAQV